MTYIRATKNTNKLFKSNKPCESQAVTQHLQPDPVHRFQLKTSNITIQKPSSRPAAYAATKNLNNLWSIFRKMHEPEVGPGNTKNQYYVTWWL